ncbi:MAG: pyridoxal-phosphate dependent enzyme [Candidatus Thermoplasmatota archaeon]|nr:pyridoxal-phosphate dependent enzyme [Candidatus Thermoplasmatota archaeon]
MKPTILCRNCKAPRENIEYKCRKCGGTFFVKISWKYSENLRKNFPYINKWIIEPEFNTPIFKFNNLSMKLDYFTPTLSYKDRGMLNLFSSIKSNEILPSGSQVNEDSSGNAGASFTFFAKIAGFSPNVFVSANSNRIKLEQTESYGANISLIEGSREDLFRAAVSSHGTYLGHTYMAEFIDGIRSLPYEIFEQTDRIPDRIFIPVSAGTLLLGFIYGIENLLDSGEIDHIPEIIAVQPGSICPLFDSVYGLRQRKYEKSIADALVTINSPHLKEMTDKIKQYGRVITVTDNEIKDSRNALILKGIYTEYSSATTLAAYEKTDKSKNSLLILTGSGIKNI